MQRLIDMILQEPTPCPSCGSPNIQSWFVGGCRERKLPYWVQMRCARCGRRGKVKLFRFRAVLDWNREKTIPRNCWTCIHAEGCKSWYGGDLCSYKYAIAARGRRE